MDENVNEETVTTDANVEEADQQPKPIATPQNELYAALQEERIKRKDAEKRLKEMEGALPTPPTSHNPQVIERSDEGRAIEQSLKNDISKLEATVRALQENDQLKGVLAKHPILNEQLVEFDEYRKGYAGMPIDKVAMVFLAEKGALLKQVVHRPGLEQPSGGTHQPPTAGVSVEELTRLRTEDPRTYIKMLREGKIKLADIKRN